jgi:hypothetical protein
MASLKEIKARLHELELGNEYGYRSEIKLLPNALAAGETVLALSSGIREGRRWYLVFTEQRLLLLAKPTMGDPRLISLPREDLVEVTGHRGLIFGKIQVRTALDTYTFTNVLKKSLPSFLGEAVRR